MECRTCEQYVLERLADEEAENEMLRDQLEKAEGEVSRLVKEAERSGLELAMDDAARECLFDRVFYPLVDVDGPDGRRYAFDEWAERSIAAYSLPSGVTAEGATSYFEPELRDAYDRRAAARDAL